MTQQEPDRPDGVRAVRWPEPPEQQALQLIAEGVTQVAGFGVSAISVVRPGETLEVVAVAGSDEAREFLAGMRTPISRLERELAKADDWGLLRFLPEERLEPGGGDDWGWVPDVVPLDVPDAWHPLDLLVAPLFDADGRLRGSLVMDLPVDGRRPDEAQRLVLNTYAEQAGRAVLTALEREALAERVRLADAARTVVRTASAELSLDRLLRESQSALVEGFQADGTWIQTFDSQDYDKGAIYSSAGIEVELSPDLMAIAQAAARHAWAQQRVLVVGRDHGWAEGLGEVQAEAVHAFLDTIAIATILVVPLGAGRECLGNLVLARAEGGPEWTEIEGAAALDIGHDLGRAVLTARTFEREHRLVEDLQELDAYKSRLIATVSHELKNPLTAISGRLELLESAADLDPFVRSSLDAMDRGARRLGRIVDDLLLLAKVGDPHVPMVSAPVDVRRVVDDVVDLVEVGAAAKDLTITVLASDEPIFALGDQTEIDRVVSNLVGNAVKYTPAGRTITLDVHCRPGPDGDEVVLTCRDEGIGMSEGDQAQVFGEFFRSSDPVAVAEPGTGLGLAIVKRIVARHRGRIEVTSELGVGSTFRVFLPAA